MTRYLHILLLILCLYGASSCPMQAEVVYRDSTLTDTISTEHKTSFFAKIGRGIGRLIDEFSTYDSAYIEPQHFKFQVMMQLSNEFDYYTISSKEGLRLRFSPDAKWRVGPYVGYSLIFLGYTIQLNNFYIGDNTRTFDLSLYTAMLGGDFYYRNTNDFHINSISYDDFDFDFSDIEGNPFSGFHVESWGFNTYYLFNHHRHSYPAAYNQSTRQKISTGAPLVGFGYGNYKLSMDWAQLDGVLIDNSSISEPLFEKINYQNYSLYGGYSYNWVFAKNWLLGTSAAAALSYHHSEGAIEGEREKFSFSNIALDGIGRMGIVWNNDRLFAGAAAQVHIFNYRRDQFSISNMFGGINIYAGINFGKKKAYRKPGNFFEF